MSKWIAIGDIHGRDTWKEIVNLEFDSVDKIIFVGDYFDSFNISVQKQISNFLDILEFKRNNKDKVVLLTGNHDFHYIDGVKANYSGYSYAMALSITTDCIMPALNEKSLQLCYIDNDFLFTHAGVTKTWLLLSNIIESLNDDINDLDIKLNDAFFYKPNTFKFQSSYKFSLSNSYGNNIWQGPLWVRPESLEVDRIDGYNQVVGHTEIFEPESTDGLYFIDSLDRGYYLYNDGENIEIKNINSVSSP